MLLKDSLNPRQSQQILCVLESNLAKTLVILVVLRSVSICNQVIELKNANLICELTPSNWNERYLKFKKEL